MSDDRIQSATGERVAAPADCIMCAIATGSEPASIVYDMDGILGIMSLDQPAGYKALVLPRAHVETIFALSDDQAGDLFRAAARIARAVRAASGCAGLNVVQSNGAAAGQEVDHVHIHLLPRTAGDGIVLDWPMREAERHELDLMAGEIRDRLRAL